MRSGFRTDLAGAAAAALMTAAPAAAQEVAETQDIVVTAQFRSQRLQDTPLAITAVTGDMLTARSQTSIAQVAFQSPNVNLQEASATFGPAVSAFIRGVGQGDSSFALEPGVGVYVDDVYYSTLQGSLLDLLDLDRVEILRGPQGTLSGQNAIGGAIKLYSKRPNGDGKGFVQGTYGRFDRTELRAGADFTVVPDALYARISGAGVQKNGYVTRYDYACTHPGTTVPSFRQNDGCKLGTQGGKSYAAVRGALRWTGPDRLEVNLIGDYTRDRSEATPSTLLYVGGLTGAGVGTQPPTSVYYTGGIPIGTASGSPFISYSPYGSFAQDGFTRSPYVSYENFLNSAPADGSPPYSAPDRSSVDGWGGSAQIEYELADRFALTSITAYRTYNGLFTSGDATPANTALVANRVKHRQFSQEVRLNGAIGDLADFTVGGYYLRTRSEYGARVQLAALAFTEVDTIPARTKAAFANAEVHVLPGFDVIGGIRYTDITKTFRYGRGGVPGNIYGGLAPPALRPLDGRVGRFSGDRVDYRAVAQYRVSPALMGYVQYATGFKSGGVNPRPFFPSQALPHDPETLDAYEAGFKSDLFGRRLRLNGAVFLNRYDDILVTAANCPLPGSPAAPCALPINAGQADVKGAELEAAIRPTAALMIDASIGYLDFKYTSISAAGQSSGVQIGMRGPFVSKWQYSLGLQYAAELGGAGSITPRLDLAHRSSFFGNSVNNPFNRVAGYTLLNGRLTYSDPARLWQIALEVTNVTDKLYYRSVTDSRASTLAVFGQPAPPREWAVSVRRNF